MRNDVTDRLGDLINGHFKKSGLTTREYIYQLAAQRKVFDTTNCTFHFLHCNMIVSAYYDSDSRKWYAKY